MHYKADPADEVASPGGRPWPGLPPPPGVPPYQAALGEPQWVSADVRTLDMSVLGQFGVILADPPWDIHMDLPYGTLSDDEMRNLDLGCLQTEGVLALWVTGRAAELGRECLAAWGYTTVQELVWVKTNQLQRIVRSGRTGHWLNHSKEHCLLGVKGALAGLNAGVDCDVVVAEVRETSRKPDEVYSLLERLSPGSRKLEIFGRPHNTRPGWVTLGNQLQARTGADRRAGGRARGGLGCLVSRKGGLAATDPFPLSAAQGVRLVDESLRQRFLERYPERAAELSPPVAGAAGGRA